MSKKKNSTKKTGLYKFWATLRSLANSRAWKRDLNGAEIRLYDKDGNEYCPLTAVHKKLTGEELNLGQTNTARKNLGMADNYETRIVSAADDNCDTSAEKKLRRKLIKELKLSKKYNKFKKECASEAIVDDYCGW